MNIKESPVAITAEIDISKMADYQVVANAEELKIIELFESKREALKQLSQFHFKTRSPQQNAEIDNLKKEIFALRQKNYCLDRVPTVLIDGANY